MSEAPTEIPTWIALSIVAVFVIFLLAIGSLAAIGAHALSVWLSS